MREELENWWSDNSGGRDVTLTFGPSDSIVSVLQLSERHQSAEPWQFSLSSVVAFSPSLDTTDSRVHLELAWGNPRSSLIARVDAGQTVNLAGNYLRIAAMTFGAVGASGGAVLALNVTRSTAQPTTRPRLTYPLLAEVAAAAVVGPFLVPPFARRVCIATSFDPTAGANPLLAQWFTRQPVAALFAQAQLGGATADQFGWQWTPVPTGAGALFVTNGAVVTNIQPIWELAL
jgi:hypothetical protein